MAGRIVVLCLVGLVAAVGPQAVWGQGAPDNAEIELRGVGAACGTVPFWLHANTDGLVDPISSGMLLRGRVERTVESEGRWGFGYGSELVGRVSANETLFFPTLYATARYGFLKLRIGRKAEVIGTVGKSLTSGSLGQSRNATPIPKVVLSTDGYTAVPFTEQWIELKGRYADGLLPDRRHIEDAYLHQKTFYLRTGTPSPVQVYGGLVHNAMWGGTDPDWGRLPQSFNDYVRTVVALSGADDAPRGERIYIQGDHFGVIDFGLSVDIGLLKARAYRHFIYEDRDNLKFKSPQDGLFGVELADTRSGRWIDRVVYEHLYTKWQNGPVKPDPQNPRGGAGGRDDYYTHFIFNDGWTLYGRTAGSPLITSFPREDGRSGIENNRVVGHHLGVAGHVGALEYRVLATYTRNYGRYDLEERALEDDGEYRFQPPLEQASFLVEAQVPWPSRPQLQVSGAVGLDVGALYEQSIGARLGLSYQLSQ